MDSEKYIQKKYCFSELISQSPIRIPKIQRDYAQGRKNEIVNEIRDRFVHNLISAISYESPLELDFIYGSNRNDAFEPLDGQQRLTTMFLLHWMLGYNLYDSTGDKSLLTYRTRDTSTDFCLELVQHNSGQFRMEAETKNAQREAWIKTCCNHVSELEANGDKEDECYALSVKKAKEDLAMAKDSPVLSVSDIIKNRDWFNYLWSFDPTIQSMLVMIDSIWKEMDWDLDLNKCRSNLDQITFSYLNLGDFGLSDELFIKMNARGKQLSSFDFVKSTLEEEIQIQKKEGHCDTKTEEKWRSLIDGKWIDWFWNMFASEHVREITEDKDEYKKRLGYAREAENKLKVLILRLVCLQLFHNTSIDESVRNAAYNDSVWDLDKLIPAYQDSLKDARKGGLESNQTQEINFNNLIDDLNSLFYRSEDMMYHSIFDLIPDNFNINCDNPGLSCLDFVLGDKLPNDCKVIFYALLKYLKTFPVVLVNEEEEKSNIGVPSDDWKSDFLYWAHACRNIFINDNNNERIDTPEKFKTSINAIDILIEEMGVFIGSSEQNTVNSFFATLGEKNYKGIDNQSLKEEVQKAILCTDSSWENRIEKAESQNYLWGQIRFLLDWSQGDCIKFEDYTKRISEIMDYARENEDNSCKLRAALIYINPDFGFNGTRLYQFNKDRDNSVKRYLRDESCKGNSGLYGYAFKNLIDKWTDEYVSSPFSEFVDYTLLEGLKMENSYARCIISEPSILKKAWNMMIFNHNGHYVLAQRKTINSHCFDIALLYLWYKLYDNPDIKDLVHYDSVGNAHQYAISYTDKDGNKILIQQATDGKYESYIDLGLVRTFENEKDLLDSFTV